MSDHTKNQLWKWMKTRLLILIPVVLGMLAAVATLTFAATSSLDIFEVPDPVGDAQGYTNPNHDITSFAARTDGSVISLTVVFSGTVYSPAGDPNYAVLGYIDLDTDQNQATGKPPHTSIYTQFPPSNLGMDYYIDLSRYVSGWHPEVGVVDAQNNLTVGNAKIIFRSGTISSAFTVTVPLSLIGGDDGYVNAAAIMFNTTGPTDSVPNGGYLWMYSDITYLPLINRW